MSNATQPSKFAPVFEREGNRLIILHQDWVADDREGAWQIGLGTQLVECILYGIKNTHDVVEIVDGQIPHFPAKLGAFSVALISGPMFDKYTAPVSAPATPTGDEPK